MCPEVQSRASGTCPKCGMKLVAQHGRGAFVCLEHAEEGALDLEEGKCRLCGEELDAVPTRRVYACAIHDQVVGTEAGSCPVCEKELRPQRMAVVWECDEHGVVALDKGRCRRCDTELAEGLLALPHGDHVPKHGGLFFMAPDRWHHLEGTLARPGTFRLYLYDNFTRPMSTKGVSGYVRTGTLAEDGSLELADERHALTEVADTNYFEAASPAFRLPLDLTLVLDLDAGKGKTDRFDFTFESFSVVSPDSRATAPGDDAAAKRAAAERRLEIPATKEEILGAIDERRDAVRRLVEKRTLALLYKPALEAKELALALMRYAEDVPSAERGAFDRALYQAVRGAWLLDFHGDRGESAEVREAHEVFALGLDRLKLILAPSGE